MKDETLVASCRVLIVDIYWKFQSFNISMEKREWINETWFDVLWGSLKNFHVDFRRYPGYSLYYEDGISSRVCFPKILVVYGERSLSVYSLLAKKKKHKSKNETSLLLCISFSFFTAFIHFYGKGIRKSENSLSLLSRNLQNDSLIFNV